MAAKVSDNDCNGLYGIIKDVMESVYNKGVERGKYLAQKENDRLFHEECGCKKCPVYHKEEAE